MGGEKESGRQQAEEKKEDKKDKTVAHRKDEPDKKNKERDLSIIYSILWAVMENVDR